MSGNPDRRRDSLRRVGSMMPGRFGQRVHDEELVEATAERYASRESGDGDQDERRSPHHRRLLRCREVALNGGPEPATRSRRATSRRRAAASGHSGTARGPASASRPARRGVAAASELMPAIAGSSCVAKIARIRCAASALVVLDRSSTTSASSRSQRSMKCVDQARAHSVRGRRRTDRASAGRSPPRRRTAGPCCRSTASPSTGRCWRRRRSPGWWPRSKPDWANRSLAAARITALVSVRGSTHANKCRPTSVDIARFPRRIVMPTSVGIDREEGEDHEQQLRHRCPRRRSRPDRADAGRVAGAAGHRDHRRRPAGRGRQHLARGGR